MLKFSFFCDKWAIYKYQEDSWVQGIGYKGNPFLKDKGNGMSEFGIKILIRVLIPYTFGIFFTYFGGKRLLKKEKVVESVLYTLLGLFLSLGAIIHLLFVANIGMYS